MPPQATMDTTVRQRPVRRTVKKDRLSTMTSEEMKAANEMTKATRGFGSEPHGWGKEE